MMTILWESHTNLIMLLRQFLYAHQGWILLKLRLFKKSYLVLHACVMPKKCIMSIWAVKEQESYNFTVSLWWCNTSAEVGGKHWIYKFIYFIYNGRNFYETPLLASLSVNLVSSIPQSLLSLLCRLYPDPLKFTGISDHVSTIQQTLV